MNAADVILARQMVLRNCAGCGCCFDARRVRSPRKWCSKKCRQRVEYIRSVKRRVGVAA